MTRRRGMQEAEALDVIQQVFVSVARSIEDWSPIAMSSAMKCGSVFGELPSKVNRCLTWLPRYSATDDPHMLGRIGSYEVNAQIGIGGMGVVFKAFDGALNRFVAINMMQPLIQETIFLPPFSYLHNALLNVRYSVPSTIHGSY